MIAARQYLDILFGLFNLSSDPNDFYARYAELNSNADLIEGLKYWGDVCVSSGQGVYAQDYKALTLAIENQTGRNTICEKIKAALSHSAIDNGVIYKSIKQFSKLYNMLLTSNPVSYLKEREYFKVYESDEIDKVDDLKREVKILKENIFKIIEDLNRLKKKVEQPSASPRISSLFLSK